MEYKDYYKVLGLERDVAQDEIKRTYRKLARKFHPDVNKEPAAEARFKEIGEAYAVLKEVEKRAAYDHLGQGWQPGQDFQAPENWDAGFEFSGGEPNGSGGGFSDFFETLFGRLHQGGSTPRGQTAFRARGEDHHAKVLIDISDSFKGAERSISLRVPDIDETGHIRLRDRTLKVQVPKGIMDGQHVRLKGQGAPGLGGMPAGDLYLEVQFKPDKFYRADGRNLYMKLPVTPWEAALGASVQLSTPQGPIMLKIPAGSAQGRELRIKGRGIPAAEPGNLYAVLNIVLPLANTDKAKKAYEDMARGLAFDPRAELGA